MTLGRGYYEPARDALIRWLRQPQRVWLRRATFQIHLWTGLAIGLYVVVLSITGSVLVYRNELDRYLAAPRAAFDEQATPMTADQLRAAAERAYPGWTVTTSMRAATGPAREARRPRRRPGVRPIPRPRSSLNAAAKEKDRLFNPYTGEDLGDSTTRGSILHPVARPAPR